MKILGIDEAGRGPVIGPLVMCGYMIDEGNLPELKKLGVKDSKLLTAKKRSSMLARLMELSDDMVILKIPAKEIDKTRTISNLNKMEIERMQHIINLLNPDVAKIDALESNTKKFHAKVACKIDKRIKLVTENFADKNHIEVGAASIVAKVHRDDEIEKLHEKYGFFGTGYPSDPRTIRFLKNWIEKNKEFPDFVRSSWITAQCIKGEKEQTDLKGF